MEINADFTQRALVHSEDLPWQASPMPGVERRMLDRIGEEVARATSIVRYAPGSAFSEHTHSGGEEFIVLEGTFQDEYGDYPAGTYVRNPIGTHHIPRADDGCTILVKLWQFDPADQAQFSLDLNTLALAQDAGRAGAASALLSDRPDELVVLEQWDAGTAQSLGDAAGCEVLVLDGHVSLDGETFGKHGWLRFPPGDTAVLKAGPEGARLWIKTRHLADITLPPSA